MRYHYWQFLVNQDGQPINGASISIFKAGTTESISVYKGEYTTDVVSTSPQIITNSNGYFEFWIGDEEETAGYTRGTKFKIVWNREGVTYGSVDYIDVFPDLEGVDETDSTSPYKNKLISNALAYSYTSHLRHDVTNDGFPIHGLMTVDVLSSDSTINKVISDRNAKNWEDHKNYSFEIYTSDSVSGTAHNLQPVQTGSSDTRFNKLVSNSTINDLQQQILAYNQNIEDSVIYISVPTSGWIYDGTKYTHSFIHNLSDLYPTVTCWNTTTKKTIAFEAESIDTLTVKVLLTAAQDTYVKISKL